MGTRAYIITFVSDTQCENDGIITADTDKKQIYRVNGNEDECYRGIGTGDAPMQYLMKQAEEADRITVIAIVSRKVYRENAKNSSLTHYELFRRNLITFAERLEITEKYRKGGLYPIFYDFRKSEAGDTGTANDIMIKGSHEQTKGIINCIYEIIIAGEPESGKTAYIDFTSGLRDTSFLMTSVIQFLNFYGIGLKEIVYSNFGDQKIRSLLHITAITDLIQAVNSFNLTGNVRQLREFFGTRYIQDRIGPESSGDLKAMKDVLDSFHEFFCCISINDVGRIDECKRAIENNMENFRNIGDSPDMYVSMFSRLFGLIRREFFLDGSGTISYRDMIRWCLNHDFVNQALTLYVDKLPEEYFESACLKSIYNPETDSFAGSNTKGKNRYSDGFYTGVFDNVLLKLPLRKCPEELEMAIMKEVVFSFNAEVKDHVFGKENRKILQAEITATSFKSRTTEILRERFPGKRTDRISRALAEMGDLIRNIFEGKVPDNAELDCYGEPVKSNDIPRKILTAAPRIIHFFLYRSPDDYQRLEEISSGNRTYTKKLNIIRALMTCAEINDSVKRLAALMKMYVYAKIMRNRINHAQDENQIRKDDIADQEYALSLLAGNDFGLAPLDTTFHPEHIRDMLRKGTELPLP